MRKNALLCALLLGLTLGAPAMAADKTNIVRGSVLYSDPTGNGRAAVDPNHELKADNAFGFAFSYERRVSDLIGLNLDLSWVNPDVKISLVSESDTFGKMSIAPLTLSLLFHPLKKGDIDFYIGPGLSYVTYGDLKLEAWVQSYSDASKLAVDNELSLALQTGADIHFNEVWGLNIDLKYLDTKAKTDFEGESLNIDVNPLLLSVGVTVRF